MRLSDVLIIISTILTFVLALFLIFRIINTICFSWLDYSVMFLSLFGNLGINILAILGR